jgi:hypothetical protein
MNRKIFLLFAAVMILALGVAGFAYKRSTTATASNTMSCCGDSCPMKSKQTASTGDVKASSCDCCDRDSCPMHNAGGEKMAAKDGMPADCPMHSKDAKAQNASATADAKTSCDCSCCKHNKETAAAPAV